MTALFQHRGVAERVPDGIDDREGAEAIWPLLRAGASRQIMVGRLVVGLGLDSKTAGERLDALVDSLLRASAASGSPAQA